MSRRSAALLLSVALAGCGVDLDFWDEREFDIDVPAGGPTSVDLNQLVDLTEHAQFKDKVSQLKTVDVTEIWLEILSLDPSNQTTSLSGRIEIAEDGDGKPTQLLASYDKLVVAQGGKVQLTWDAAGYEKVKSLAFDNPHKFRLLVKGSIDALPAKFKVKARTHVVANVGL